MKKPEVSHRAVTGDFGARGIRPEDVSEIVCEVAEGTVHRLWEPLADKQRPNACWRSRPK